MRAIQIAELTGPDSALRYVELPEPEPVHPLAPPGEEAVVVEVHAAGVSFPEVLQTRGEYQFRPPLPFVPGSEVGGVVRSAPAGCGLQPGDRVAAFTALGAFAETAVAPAFFTFKLPDALDFAQGAGLVLNYHTAYFALRTRGRLTRARRVLVHGAAGGVGTAALQVARGSARARSRSSRREAKERVAREAGADEVVRSDGPWKDEVKALGGGVDLVLDPVGGDRFTDSLRSLREGGRVVVVGFTGGSIPEVRVNRLLLDNTEVIGAGWGAYAMPKPDFNREVGAAIDRLIERGYVRPLVGAHFDVRGRRRRAQVHRRAAGDRQGRAGRASGVGRPPWTSRSTPTRPPSATSCARGSRRTSRAPAPHGDEDAHYAWRRDWQRRLADGGWAAVHWPAEHGGRGATLTQSAIFYEELAAAGAPLPANVLGLLLAGPTIMTWGTPEQQERHLVPILTAEEIWCQGFSEPDAGSDLAALKTRAVKDGDEWVITGQKVWTSMAQYAKWCMLVARTDADAPKKHQGLTYFLMDMEQDGVEIVPLKQITGESEFNELFLDGARMPDANVLGGVGNGWKVALTTLMNERVRARLLPAGADAAAARPADRRGGRTRAAGRPGRRRQARRAAPALRGAAPDRLPRPDRDRDVRPARAGGLADEVDVVGHEPAADAAGGRHPRAGGA